MILAQIKYGSVERTSSFDRRATFRRVNLAQGKSDAS